MEFQPQIQKALIEDLKISSFTEIQQQAIPAIMNGENVIGISKTGSGKTLSYVLPVLNQIVGSPKRPTKVLIITPTKELSEQILSVVKKTARHTPLLSMSLYGGKSFNDQSVDLRKGVHVLVACPGRLKDHIEKQTVDLSGVEYLILDEADQLMDMGFLPAVTEAINACTARKQTLLFSATLSPEVQLLIKEFLPQARMIELHNTKPKEAIAETFCPISAELKYPFLRFLLKHKKMKACLIFTRTKEEAQALGNALKEDKYEAETLQGDMTTHQRKKALDALRLKKASILVATDVVARGIDIPHVAHVINWNPPESLESYVHRIGRTARHEKSGEAITLYTPEELPQLEKIMGERPFKPSKVKEFNYQLKLNRKQIKII